MNVVRLQSLLPEGIKAREMSLRVFALLSLGVIESLDKGVLRVCPIRGNFGGPNVVEGV